MLTSPITTNSFCREMEQILEKEALDVTLPMVMTGLGAGAGGLAGYTTTREPNKKLRNAIVAALLGGGAGYGLGKAIDKGPSGPPTTGQMLDKYLRNQQEQAGLQKALTRGVQGQLNLARTYPALAEQQRQIFLNIGKATEAGAVGTAQRAGLGVFGSPEVEQTAAEVAAQASFPPPASGSVYTYR